MTRFTGPLKVKVPFSDTTVMRVDASGSAVFAQGANFTGTVQVLGRVRQGAGAATLGDMVLTQQVDLPADNTKVTAAVLPDGADILDIKLFIETPPESSAASQVDILVGTSVQDARFARFSNVSAQGYYTAVNSAQTSAWTSVSGANAVVIIHTTAASGAIASATSGRLSVIYVHRQ